jgi:hypothetical protein
MPSSMTLAAAVVTNLNLADKLQRFNFTVGAVLFVFLFLFYVDVACVVGDLSWARAPTAQQLQPSTSRGFIN